MITPELFYRAKRIYAENPSHAPPTELPNKGTYCFLSAISQSHKELTGNALGPFAGGWIFSYLRMEHGIESPIEYNAEHSTEEVLDLFDKCAAVAERHTKVARPEAKRPQEPIAAIAA